MKTLTNDKVIMVNIKKPSEIRYIKLSSVGVFMLGRRLNDYVIIMTKEERTKTFVMSQLSDGEINQMQALVEDIYNSL